MQESGRWSREIIMSLEHGNRINVEIFIARARICCRDILNGLLYASQVRSTKGNDVGFKKPAILIKKKNVLLFLIVKPSLLEDFY